MWGKVSSRSDWPASSLFRLDRVCNISCTLYNCYQIFKSLNIKFDGWSLCFLFIYQFFNPDCFRYLNCKVIFSMEIEYRCSKNRSKFSVRSQWTSCSVSRPLIWHHLDIGPGRTFCPYFLAQMKLLRLLFNLFTQ